MFTSSLIPLVLVALPMALGVPIRKSGFQSQVIYQSPNSLFLENIAVRADSNLLLTSVASPTLFTLDPTTINGTLDAVHTFPNATSITGITEFLPEVFAVAVSELDTTTRRTKPNTTVIWGVDFSTAEPQTLGRLPGNASANGLATIPGHPDVILAADSNLGVVWQVDTRSGATRQVIKDASMLPNAPPPALGINGLHVAQVGNSQFLYFTNSAQGTFSRVAIGVEMGVVKTAAEIQTLLNLQPDGQAPDDFVMDPQGRAWVAVHPGALDLLSVPRNGNGSWSQQTIAGNTQGSDPGLLQATSAAFGRGSQKNALFVTTGAGQVVKVNMGV
ncbi:hypothetical protein R3P38DRAFT_3253106 [Favolaschia claudopus]|uniref:SMP-30/Gluconolactonase/LRE-like region domain-containing protein n=1 Tax=Favolaschia claudopus TaxID=2862362 RepID=A0AAW0E5D8_9AGAR